MLCTAFAVQTKLLNTMSSETKDDIQKDIEVLQAKKRLMESLEGEKPDLSTSVPEVQEATPPTKTKFKYRKKRYTRKNGTVGYKKEREYGSTPRVSQAPVTQAQAVQVTEKSSPKVKSKGTVKIGSIVLPVNAIPDQNYVPENQYLVGCVDILEAMSLAVSQKKPTLLKGETGTGKTTLVNQLGYMTNNSVRQINLNGNTTVDEIVGRTMLNKDGTVFHDGIMIDAMRQGHWLLLDELNAGLPEVLLALQQVLIDGKYTLVEHNNEVVYAHPNFRVFATMNPPETYVGTNHLNPATLSRFGVTIEVQFPSDKLELEIIKSKLPKEARTPDSEIMETIRLASDIRNGYQQQEYSYMLSTRDLISWLQINEHYGDLVRSAEYTVLGKCNQDDRTALESILKVYFSAPLDVTPNDGQYGMKYRKGNLIQVCDDLLEIYDSKNYDKLGTAKSGAIIEVMGIKNGTMLARLLKGEVTKQNGTVQQGNVSIPVYEKLTLSHRDIVKLGDFSKVSSRRIDTNKK